MKLTPYDIHNKEFKRSFRGYDVDEVNDFLDQIIKDFELLTREKLEMEQQVEDLQAELERIMDGEAFSQTRPQPQYQVDPVQPMMTQQQQQQQQQQNQYPTPQNQMQMQQQMQQMQQQMQNQLQAMQPNTNALASMEQSIHKSIRVAQEVAEEVRLNAKKEAELIVQEAEKNADRIINEALQKARAVHSELLDLKQKSTIYRARFRTLVQSHLDVLDNSSWESLEELEENLEETGKQLDAFAEQSVTPSLEQPQNQQEYLIEGANGFGNEYDEFPNEFPNELANEFPQMGENHMLGEVASTYMEDDQEPNLRRTRKMRKKAMF
ncbi:DivIVA domain-containing protein [Thermoactinomyces sp. DSM 45891]|uniref:DivIVA domain-containing protein n=1 Tax=Thermoactinomyces sp. DSM 45891 TaxID=1761907 RepID=UPI00091F92EE|nr:DivIVA domain-containing protein [Thermoactinomyces sp. DSM 45891]SFX26494.1 DivIVA domain-containing protein [Thermoactinomyces sp. DSM 45891]